jgi:hypothetical protein
MPKVSKIKLKVDDTGEQEFPIYYSRKEGFTIKGFPPEILSRTGVKASHYDTEYELTCAIEQAVKDYLKMMETSDEVILYSFRATTALTRQKIGHGSYGDIQPGVHASLISHFADGVSGRAGITLYYERALRVTDGVKVKYYTVDEDTGVSEKYARQDPGKGWLMVPYTEENMNFFRNIESNLQQLVYAVSRFLSSDNPELFMRQHQGLLNPPAGERRDDE